MNRFLNITLVLKNFVTMFAIILLFFCDFSSAAETIYPLSKMQVDVTDYASLQRGVKLYVNYCQGCHSLQYLRYGDLARGIGVTDEEGNLHEEIVKDSLLFVGTKLSDPILSGMREDDAANWFGKAAPDLSLITKVRGVNWVYTYLKSFYRDDTKIWGTNNLVFPDVGMPHVLSDLQGVQIPIIKKTVKQIGGEKVVESVVESLRLESSGAYSIAEYDKAVQDLVNFLAYCADPKQHWRRIVGGFALLFLGLLLIFSYLLKREYWKDIGA